VSASSPGQPPAAWAASPDLHRDPFDRLLVAQARLEELTMATADEILSKYEVAVIALATSRAASPEPCPEPRKSEAI